MIAYQVPAVMRHLSAMQIFDEGITSFLAAGIFSLLADTGKALTIEAFHDLTDWEGIADLHQALEELQTLQLIEQVQITDASDIDRMLAELTGEVTR